MTEEEKPLVGVNNMVEHEHKQVRTYCKALDATIEVDEGIAPLLQAIWIKGIVTVDACQDDGSGSMLIQFLNPGGLKTFLEILLDGIGDQYKRDNRLLCRILGYTKEPAGKWRYNVILIDRRGYLNPDTNKMEMDFTKPSNIVINTSVAFPISDYPRVLELMKVGRTS